MKIIALTPTFGKSLTTNGAKATMTKAPGPRDRKSTRLNSSHLVISYAVFCLKKKKNREVLSALDKGRSLMVSHRIEQTAGRRPVHAGSSVVDRVARSALPPVLGHRDVYRQRR